MLVLVGECPSRQVVHREAVGAFAHQIHSQLRCDDQYRLARALELYWPQYATAFSKIEHCHQSRSGAVHFWRKYRPFGQEQLVSAPKGSIVGHGGGGCAAGLSRTKVRAPKVIATRATKDHLNIV